MSNSLRSTPSGHFAGKQEDASPQEGSLLSNNDFHVPLSTTKNDGAQVDIGYVTFFPSTYEHEKTQIAAEETDRIREVPNSPQMSRNSLM
jgi:hypothetical protein